MKILVILASGIGNSILFSPTLISLRKNYPNSQIDIFAYKPQFAEPFKDSKIINNIYYYKGFKTILSLKKQRYDISITAFPSNKWQFNLFAYLIKANKRITHKYKVGKLSTLSFLQNKKFPAQETLHDVEQNLNMLKLLNIKIPEKKYLYFNINLENEKFANDFIKTNNLKNKYLIGVHPGSGPLKFKKAPIKNFIELITQNRKKNKNSVILIFGGPEEEKIKQEVKELLKEKAFIINSSLKNTAALIKRCNLFITNDSGLMHIASTSNKTKIIALFNGTNPTRTRPYKNNAKTIILRPNKLKYPFYSTKAREE